VEAEQVKPGRGVRTVSVSISSRGSSSRWAAPSRRGWGSQRGVKGELIAQREGPRQHPLAHGHPGDDAVDQLGGKFAHAAPPARGAEATPFAAEGHDHLISALLAPDMHAPVLEPAAAQVGAELAGDEGGEPIAAALIGSAGQEGLEMALEGAVEDVSSGRWR
jgi:hypothetical protein